MLDSKDVGAVVVGGGLAGDGSGMTVAQFDELFHASRGVVESKRLHFGMFGEETPALRQCHWMGEDAIDVSDRGSGYGNQIVADAKERLTLHCDVVGQQQIEVLQRPNRQGCFQWG